MPDTRPDLDALTLTADFASAFIRIRGAHNPKPGEPCAWCWLAAEQATEAVLTTVIRDRLASSATGDSRPEKCRHNAQWITEFTDWVIRAHEQRLGDSRQSEGLRGHGFAALDARCGLTCVRRLGHEGDHIESAAAVIPLDEALGIVHANVYDLADRHGAMEKLRAAAAPKEEPRE